MPPVRAGGGFTLLEAIVALVLLSTSGIAIYSLINSNLIGFNRVRAVATRTVAVRNALEWMHQINPAETPEGTTESNGLRIDWQARPLAPMIDGHGYPRNISYYQMGLFDTEVAVSRDGDEIAFFHLRQVGYRKVRE